MLFGEKLKKMRQSEHMTQEQLAEKIDITKRTLINYEQGKCYPKQTEILCRIAEIFNVSVDYMMSDEDYYIYQAEKSGGIKAKREVQELVTEIGGLFAGGELSEDDKDKVLRMITELYWDAKEKNKKYGQKK